MSLQSKVKSCSLLNIFGVAIVCCHALTLLYVSSALAREMTLSWEPMGSVSGYEVQVGRDKAFKDIFTQQKVQDPKLTVTVPLGRFFYRVRAIDAKNRPGKWSNAIPVAISGYPPELKAPKTGEVYSYFEIPPTITFEWKPAGGEPEYSIFIYKSTGQKVLEERLKATTFTTSKLEEGEYGWKVRSIYDKTLESSYVEPRQFVVEKKPLHPPVLVAPKSDKPLAAYRPASFEWKKDPNTHFSDIHIRAKNNSYKAEEKNIQEKEKLEVPYLEPGEMKWSATNKEAKTTPGVTSKEEDFLVRNDLVSSGNTYVYLGIAPSKYTVTTAGVETTRVQMATYLSLRYFPMENIGFSVDFMAQPYDRAPYTIPLQKFSGAILFRAGVAGFAQDWALGYRQMDNYAADPAGNSYYFTSSGPYVALQMWGTVKIGWRFELGAGYYKPIEMIEHYATLAADHYEGHLGFGYNFFDQFWGSYKVRYEKTVINISTGPANFQAENQRLEPVHLGVSWEY